MSRYTPKLELDEKINDQILVSLASEKALDYDNEYYTDFTDKSETAYLMEDENYLIMESLVSYYNYVDNLSHLVEDKKDK